jgi:Fe-S-cluster-containing hydrogenase component 2
MPLVQAKCDSCLECVRVCPVGSLVAKDGQACAAVSR